MNANITKRNETFAKTVIKGLESRGITGYYVKTKEEALKLALELISIKSKSAWTASPLIPSAVNS